MTPGAASDDSAMIHVRALCRMLPAAVESRIGSVSEPRTTSAPAVKARIISLASMRASRSCRGGEPEVTVQSAGSVPDPASVLFRQAPNCVWSWVKVKLAMPRAASSEPAGYVFPDTPGSTAASGGHRAACWPQVAGLVVDVP